jgi:hypothetical protein
MKSLADWLLDFFFFSSITLSVTLCLIFAQQLTYRDFIIEFAFPFDDDNPAAEIVRSRFEWRGERQLVWVRGSLRRENRFLKGKGCGEGSFGGISNNSPIISSEGLAFESFFGHRYPWVDFPSITSPDQVNNSPTLTGLWLVNRIQLAHINPALRDFRSCRAICASPKFVFSVKRNLVEQVDRDISLRASESYKKNKNISLEPRQAGRLCRKRKHQNKGKSAVREERADPVREPTLQCGKSGKMENSRIQNITKNFLLVVSLRSLLSNDNERVFHRGT